MDKYKPRITNHVLVANNNIDVNKDFVDGIARIEENKIIPMDADMVHSTDGKTRCDMDHEIDNDTVAHGNEKDYEDMNELDEIQKTRDIEKIIV